MEFLVTFFFVYGLLSLCGDLWGIVKSWRDGRELRRIWKRLEKTSWREGEAE